jgi:hypothetical protein
MSDNIEGVNNLSKKLFGTPSNVCFNHATGNDFQVHVVCIYLPMLPAGIPAAGYKHIAYFDGNRPILDELHQKWVSMVIDDERPDDMTVVEALELYKSFHWVRRAPDWGAVPLSCTCPTCYANALCSDTLLVASMFDPSIRVPDDWIGATQALRKQCKSMRGTAGRKRACIAQEIAASKKKVRESYLLFLRCPQTVADAASAFANLSSSDSDHTQV